MATAAIEALQQEVAATRGVMQSAATLLAALHQRLVDAGTDPVALDALKNDLHTEREALATAVAANPVGE